MGECILGALEQVGLEACHCVGQGHDGAAVMSADTRGAAAYVKRKCPQANYTHCTSHCLNLSLVCSSKQRTVRNAYATLRKSSASSTPVRNAKPSSMQQ